MTDPMTIILCLAGAVCLVYGLIVRTAGSGTGFFLVWILIGLLCLAGAWLFGSGTWKELPAWIRRGMTGLILLGMLFLAGITALVGTAFQPQGNEEADYILVLGAQIRKDGPSKALRYRLEKACEYMNEHPDCLCILSGGQGANEPEAEADGMCRYLVSRGISRDRLILEDRSRNTVENVRNSMELFDPEADRIGIISNNFHMYRSIHIAKKQGIRHVRAIPAGSDPLFLPNNVLREDIGVVKDVLKGNMQIL